MDIKGITTVYRKRRRKGRRSRSGRSQRTRSRT
jgi:hypothetical protein